MMAKAKIIFDVERMRYPYTGLFYYCLNLAKELLKQQYLHQPALKLYAPQNALTFFEDTIIQKKHASLHKFINTGVNKFDIWHCTFQGSNYFPYYKKKGIVFTVHDINFLHENIPEKKADKYKKQLEKKLNQANEVISISEFVKHDILQNFSIHQEKIHVIYNACYSADLCTVQEPERLPGLPFIFTISVVAAKKNQHVLPALLVNNNYLLIMAGKILDENYKQKIINEAIKHRVESRVIFTGAISDEHKNWYLKNCLLFVFPSIAEGFGIPVIEAMSFGKPLLLSNYTSLPEVGGNVAFYFENFDLQHMQQKMYECLDHYNRYNDKEQIIKRSEKFNWAHAAEQHWQLYESLL